MIVLTSLNGLGLGSLGDYGGPTQTIPLLPGSPALRVGIGVSGLTTDQRGESVGTSADIGAFQSQGFTLTPVVGSTPQGTATGAAFANPLAVTVTANNPVEPVTGGVVNYAVVPGGTGAGAALSSATATIGAGGMTTVTATADLTVGAYSVTTATAGAASPATFALSNEIGVSFSNLSSPNIVYGSPTTMLGGRLASGKFAPQGQTVTVTVGNLSQTATIGGGGVFSTTFDTAALGVGTSPYTVTYSYTSDGTYSSASAGGTLAVTPAPLTITANDATKTYGQALTFAGNEFTPSGLLNGDTVDSVVLTSAGTDATAGVASSPYAITASGAAGTGLDNYTITYAAGQLTVNPALLTITANDATKTYGQALTFAGIEFTPSGLLNGDTVDSVVLTSAGTDAAAAVASSPYAITASGAAGTGLDNYTITYAAGQLTVNPALLTITANDATKTYGQVLTFAGNEFTPSGLLNGDTVNSVVLTSPGALAAAAVASSPYAITASGAAGTGLDNYTITYATGQLTVNPATPTLLLSAPGGVFNGSPFAASVTIAGTGNQATPAAKLEDVPPVVTYYVGTGTSGTMLGSTPPSQPGTYTVVAAFPGSDNYTATQPQSAVFTIAAAATNVTLSLSSGSTVYGQPVTLDAGLTFGAATPSGSITFFDGSTELSTVAVDSTGHAALTTAALAVGTHSITAHYSGNSEMLPGTSGASTETVYPASTRVFVTAQPVFKKRHRLAALGVKVQVEPIAPGAGVPTGTLIFEVLRRVRRRVHERVIGTMSLSDGMATLMVKPRKVLRKAITIVYGGDPNFTGSASPVMKVTPALLRSLARPMLALSGLRAANWSSPVERVRGR